MDVEGSVEHLTLRPHTKIQPAVSPLVSEKPDFRFSNNLLVTGTSTTIKL